MADGKRLTKGRVFYEVNPGVPDGMRVDGHGNVWTSAQNGVHCVAADGTPRTRVVTAMSTTRRTLDADLDFEQFRRSLLQETA